MGNRAVITYADYVIGYDDETRTPIYESNEFIDKSHRVGIYLHWNGGYDSVHPFLEYCKLQGYRTGDYGMARLIQVIANFFGGGLSIGVDQCRRLDCDNYDNGVYLVRDWEIVGRRFFDGEEQDSYDFYEMMDEINECQPKKMRLPKGLIRSKELCAAYLKPGDEFWHQNWNNEWSLETVKDAEPNAKRVNGYDIDELVYFGDDPTNINHYIKKTDTVRVSEKED